MGGKKKKKKKEKDDGMGENYRIIILHNMTQMCLFEI